MLGKIFNFFTNETQLMALIKGFVNGGTNLLTLTFSAIETWIAISFKIKGYQLAL